MAGYFSSLTFYIINRFRVTKFVYRPILCCFVTTDFEALKFRYVQLNLKLRKLRTFERTGFGRLASGWHRSTELSREDWSLVAEVAAAAAKWPASFLRRLGTLPWKPFSPSPRYCLLSLARRSSPRWGEGSRCSHSPTFLRSEFSLGWTEDFWIFSPAQYHGFSAFGSLPQSGDAVSCDQWPCGSRLRHRRSTPRVEQIPQEERKDHFQQVRRKILKRKSYSFIYSAEC